MLQKPMEYFRLLLEHLAWIKHQFLSGIRDSKKAGSLWGMMGGVGGVRKSIHQSWLAKWLGLGLLCWGFKGVQEEIPSEESSTLQIGSVAFPPGQCTTPSLSQSIWLRWASRQFLGLPIVETLLPVTFGYSLSSEAVVMRELRRWKRLWRRSLTRWHKRTSMGPPEVVGTVQQVHCSRRRLLRRGQEFHVCTINKRAHTKKFWKLIVCTWYIYIYIYIYSRRSFKKFSVSTGQTCFDWTFSLWQRFITSSYKTRKTNSDLYLNFCTNVRCTTNLKSGLGLKLLERHLYISLYIYIYIYVYVYVYKFINVYTYLYIYSYKYMYTYAFIAICIHMHIYEWRWFSICKIFDTQSKTSVEFFTF